MSNVLIGIIGVILFIGLALAGALFLGDRFQDAGNAGKAAAAMQSTKQISEAIQLYDLDSGQTFNASQSLDPIVPTYLKQKPVNPIYPEWGFDTRDADGEYAGRAVMAGFGFPTGGRNKAICLAAARAAGMAMPSNGDVPTSASLPNDPSGCYYLTGKWGSVGGSHYVMYSRI
jgi:type II secretory pathway pseudopilin PulG